jgi:hypothetical protein
LRTLAVAAAWLVIACAARADLMVSNAAGVKAGITGIVYYPADNSIGVQFIVTAPTGTNLTTFTIQKSFNMKSWTNYSSSVTVTGSLPLTEISDFATGTNQFYRMQLINF